MTPRSEAALVEDDEEEGDEIPDAIQECFLEGNVAHSLCLYLSLLAIRAVRTSCNFTKSNVAVKAPERGSCEMSGHFATEGVYEQRKKRQQHPQPVTGWIVIEATRSIRHFHSRFVHLHLPTRSQPK